MIASSSFRFNNFDGIYNHLGQSLFYGGETVNVGEVHAQKTEQPEWVSRELRTVLFEYSIPQFRSELQSEVKPSLPWAEDHFQERISGIPHNPPPSAEHWPYVQKGHKEHTDEQGKFSHTYPERMWPKWDMEMWTSRSLAWEPRHGIRFEYGDLNDVIDVLIKNPFSRQAYVPIWFPEDLTASRLGERVPCTLGYHFLMRDGKLNVTYFIRSCDFMRFFRDDVYMACRLCQWVCGRVNDSMDGNVFATEVDGETGETLYSHIEPGLLIMHIVSLHCFAGDMPTLRRLYAP